MKNEGKSPLSKVDMYFLHRLNVNFNALIFGTCKKNIKTLNLV